MTQNITIGDAVTVERGTTYKSGLIGEPGPVLLGLGTIQRNGGFRGDSLRTYGGESPDKLLVRPGELYASLKDVTQSADLLGAVARVPVDGPVGRLTQDTVRLDLTGVVEADYLYWVMRTPQYRAYCRAHATGTTNLGLPRDDFFSFSFPAPSDERNSLVCLLGALDDKINSNRRLISLIPQLIRSRVNALLLIETKLVPASRLATFVNGGAFTKGATGTGRMVIRIADLNSGPGPSTVYNDLEVPEDKTVRAGDILMSWSGSLGVYRWARDEAIVNQHIFKVIPSGYPAWLVFDRVEAVIEIFQGIAKDKATTMGHIQRGHLDSTLVDLPTSGAIERLDEDLGPLWRRLLVAEQEMLKLATLRDALLPELLSGRIRVPEAARAVEGAIA
ncbi:hypothetical protein [Microbacterium capsulatum]|uniref:Type I restriction modification DNA specificity domain-containing protein n=1 Tax=Microbacterium capsulatum TaxID=3041921 RepID=A0ABU0XIR5_9MICO|nr:hypothetical protein [Microbacterium sp. ASV81]MDQ4214747.1 hypothetical protein [Microbacterium sp. ASV81]